MLSHCIGVPSFVYKTERIWKNAHNINIPMSLERADDQKKITAEYLQYELNFWFMWMDTLECTLQLM